MITAIVCASVVTTWVMKFCLLPEPRRHGQRRAQLREGVNVCIQKRSDHGTARQITHILRAHGIEYSIVWATERTAAGAFLATGKGLTTLDQLIDAQNNGYVHELLFG